MAEANLSRRERPLSPHIQIYKWTLPFLMSGFHRVTGFVLYFGFALIAWWLLAAASGPSAYANVQWFYGTFIGRLVLFGYTWALIHHTLGGIRHLIWDTGRGLGDREIDWLARATIGGSIVLTLVVWVIGYLVMRGADGTRNENHPQPADALRAITARRTPARRRSGTSASRRSPACRLPSHSSRSSSRCSAAVMRRPCRCSARRWSRS